MPTIAVLKTYPPKEQNGYEGEEKAYRAFGNRHPNILRCLGSFHYISNNTGRTSTLILEYADGGTLEDLFIRNNPPYRLDDIRVFWNNFLGPTEALEAVHNLWTNRYKAFVALHLLLAQIIDIASRTHQDIKPSNIFVFSEGQPQYNHTLKIGDFGNSHVTASGSNPGIDTGGSKTYGNSDVNAPCLALTAMLTLR